MTNHTQKMNPLYEMICGQSKAEMLNLQSRFLSFMLCWLQKKREGALGLSVPLPAEPSPQRAGSSTLALGLFLVLCYAPLHARAMRVVILRLGNSRLTVSYLLRQEGLVWKEALWRPCRKCTVPITHCWVSRILSRLWASGMGSAVASLGPSQALQEPSGW